MPSLALARANPSDAVTSVEHLAHDLGRALPFRDLPKRSRVLTSPFCWFPDGYGSAMADLLWLPFGWRGRPRRGRLKGGLRFGWGGTQMDWLRRIVALWMLLAAQTLLAVEMHIWIGLAVCIAWVPRSGACRWVSRSEDGFSQMSTGIWIWDPGGLLDILFNVTGVTCLGVLFLISGRVMISIFYEEPRCNHTVSTTIACLGEQCGESGDESRVDWSADFLHSQIANSDCWVYNSQDHDNGVGNYLVDNEDLPLEFASASRKVSELNLIVQEQLIDVVHLLVCSTLVFRPRHVWPLYAPHWDALLSDFNR